MSKQEVFKNASAVLYFHPEAKIVHHEFREPVRGQSFRSVLLEGLKLMKKHGAKKWLSDDRGNGVLPPDDEVWANTEWFPKVRAVGWKKWAIVMPEKALGKLNVKRFAARFAEQGIEVQVFSEPAPAEKWLEAA